MLADGRLRRIVGWTGIGLLGAALAYAPIAAFGGDGEMVTVSRVGLAGLAFLLVASRLPRPRPPEPEVEPDVPPAAEGGAGTTHRDEA